MDFRDLKKILIVALIVSLSTVVVKADDDDSAPADPASDVPADDTPADDAPAVDALADDAPTDDASSSDLTADSSPLPEKSESPNLKAADTSESASIENNKVLAQSLSDIGSGINDIVGMLNDTLHGGFQKELLGSLSIVADSLKSLIKVQEKYFPTDDPDDDSGQSGSGNISFDLPTDDLDKEPTEDGDDVNGKDEDGLHSDEKKPKEDDEGSEDDDESEDGKKESKDDDKEPKDGKKSEGGKKEPKHNDGSTSTNDASPSASYNFTDSDIRALVDEVKVLQNILRNFTELSDSKRIHDDINGVKKVLKNFVKTGFKKILHKEISGLENVLKGLNSSDISDLSEKVSTLETVLKNSSNVELQTTVHDEIAGLINILKSLEDSDTQSLVHELGDLQNIVKNSSSAVLRKILEEELEGIDDALKKVSNRGSVNIPESQNNKDISGDEKEDSEESPEDSDAEDLQYDEEEYPEPDESDPNAPSEYDESASMNEQLLNSIMEELKGILKNRGVALRSGFPGSVGFEEYSKPVSHSPRKPIRRPVPNQARWPASGPEIPEEEAPERQPILGPAMFRKPIPHIARKPLRVSPYPPREKARPIVGPSFFRNPVPDLPRNPLPSLTDREEDVASEEMPTYPVKTVPEPSPAPSPPMEEPEYLKPHSGKHHPDDLNPDEHHPENTHSDEHHPDNNYPGGRHPNNYHPEQPHSGLKSARYSEGNEYFRSLGDNRYDFGYLVDSPDQHIQYERHETRMNNAVTGGYSVLLPDGRLQTVEYTADDTGYHPTITYSKPS